MSIKVGGAEWQGCNGEGKLKLALKLVVFNPVEIILFTYSRQVYFCSFVLIRHTLVIQSTLQ